MVIQPLGNKGMIMNQVILVAGILLGTIVGIQLLGQKKREKVRVRAKRPKK